MRSSRFGDRERRGRRWRGWWVALRWAFGLGAIVLAGTYAYDAGMRLARQDTARLEAELAALATDMAAVEAERDALKAELAEARAATEQWRQRHDAEVPKGDVAALAQLAGRRLAEGVPVDRLAFVLDQVGAVRDCPEPPQTKRFLVQTPLSSGAGAAVGFAGGTVTVTGTGDSAKDAAGNPLARFDPAKPVAIRFALIDGSIRDARGVLPLTASVVAGAEEYRFSVLAGEDGFVNVTAEACRFP